MNNFCKIFESVLHSLLTDSDDTKIIDSCPFQHGFTSNRSTETNLLSLYHTIIQNKNLNIQTDVVYLDASKAFDMMPHNVLLNKLVGRGVNPILIGILSDYLSGRKQRVVNGNSYSHWWDVDRGVPQGSALGPLLFKIFMSDIGGDPITESRILVYADDVKIFGGITDNHDCHKLQQALDIVCDWFERNNMKINQSKTCFLSFKGEARSEIITHPYSVNSVPINRVNYFKDLGIIFDDNLNFKMQIEEVIRKINSVFFFFKKNLTYWSITTTKIV